MGTIDPHIQQEIDDFEANMAAMNRDCDRFVFLLAEQALQQSLEQERPSQFPPRVWRVRAAGDQNWLGFAEWVARSLMGLWLDFRHDYRRFRRSTTFTTSTLIAHSSPNPRWRLPNRLRNTCARDAFRRTRKRYIGGTQSDS